MGNESGNNFSDWALTVVLDLKNPYGIERILKSGNRTIVFWEDGKKTVVKRADGEPDDEYTAFCAALAKKIYGSNSAVNKLIEQHTEHQTFKNKNQKKGE